MIPYINDINDSISHFFNPTEIGISRATHWSGDGEGGGGGGGGGGAKRVLSLESVTRILQ